MYERVVTARKGPAFRRLVSWAVAAAALTAAPSSPAPGGEPLCTDPNGDCQTVLIIPVKYAGYCPDPTAECPPENLQDPPRLLAADLPSVLHAHLDLFFNAWSFGTWQFGFQVLVNPNSADGWWTLPESFQAYHLARKNQQATFWKPGQGSLAVVEDAVEGIAGQASLDGLVAPLWTFNRFLVIDNNHKRGGQTSVITYNVPDPGTSQTIGHTFGGTIAGIGVDNLQLTPLLAHELGHQIGMGRAWEFYGSCPIGETPLGPFDGDCNGPWDVMAWDWEGPNHPTAFNKHSIGWLSEGAPDVLTLPVPVSPLTQSTTVQAIETHATAGYRLIRIPLAEPLPGNGFVGYHVECRRQITEDDLIPEEGVLIQWVHEPEPGVANGGYMPARVLRADPPYDDVRKAPLQAGEMFVDSLHGIGIGFDGWAGSAPSSGCQVTVEYGGSGAKPDPGFDAGGGVSPDLWVDSPLNQYGVYPQPVDADNVPTAGGDPLFVGGENRIGVRLRNLGTAPQSSIVVQVAIQQPPSVGCGAPGPAILETDLTFPPLGAGDAATSWVALTIPENKPIRAVVAIDPVPGEQSSSNNQAERVFTPWSSNAAIQVDGPVVPAKLDLVLVNNCPGTLNLGVTPQALPSVPFPDPDPTYTWRVVDPGPVALAPGGEAVMDLILHPPSPYGPGSSLSIPWLVLGADGASSLDDEGFEPYFVDGFTATVRVVQQTFVTLDVDAGPHIVGGEVTLDGSLVPPVPWGLLALQYTSPSGDTTLRTVAADAIGAFLDRFTPAEVGMWRAEAIWPGDEEHSDARSGMHEFEVVPEGYCAADPDCNDGNPCTQDTCDLASNECRTDLEPDGLPCQDNDPCTSGDTCLGGVCGTPVTCDDEDPCTLDICDSQTGACSNPQDDPLAVSGLVFRDRDTLTWPFELADGVWWNTYRGTVPPGSLGARPEGSEYDHVCLEPGDALGDGPGTTTDRQTPSPPVAYYYLVTEDGVCGEGPTGPDSLGNSRPLPAPCP